MKRLPLLLAGSALLLVSGGAFADSGTSTTPIEMAQTTTPSSDATTTATPPAETNTATQGTQAASGEMGINQLVGVDIHNPQNQKVGEIKDLLISSDNKIDTAIVNVGGLMGVAGRNVAVAWNQIQLTHDQDKIKATINMTEDQLKALPEYTSDNGVWHTK
jgi:hypothetical protein